MNFTMYLLAQIRAAEGAARGGERKTEWKNMWKERMKVEEKKGRTVRENECKERIGRLGEKGEEEKEGSRGESWSKDWGERNNLRLAEHYSVERHSTGSRIQKY